MRATAADLTAGRLARCRQVVRDAGLQAVLVSDVSDVRYLSGFRGDDTVLVVGDDLALICTDARYWAQVREEVVSCELVEVGDAGLLATACAAARDRLGDGFALGYQAGSLSHAHYRGLRRSHHGRLRDVGARVTALRRVKDAAEIGAIARAAALTDIALEAVLGDGLAGRSEAEVAWHVRRSLHDAGAEDEAFATIVAAGPRGALAHAVPGERRIASGDLVVIDTGARVDGYCSDITRTVVVGRPHAEQRRVYEVVRAAQAAGLAAVRAGAHGRDDVDAAARAVIADAGLADRFGHGTGHGVGLEVHEAPLLGRTRGDRLEAGMVCTVEPGVYVEGSFGVRIEDTVVVTATGCDVVTHTPKELRRVD